MSRKKCTIDDYFFTRLAALMVGLGYGERQHYKFAVKIGISATYLSAILKRKKNPSFDTIYAIANKFPKANLEWLLSGEGEMFRQEDDTYIYKDALDPDPEVAKLLTMTREILKSKTNYAVSLAANIHSFHESVEMVNELNELKGCVRNHETRLAVVEKRKPAEIDPPPAAPIQKKDTGT